MISQFNTILLFMGVVASLIITQCYVVGFELHRFYTPSWMLLGVALMLLWSKGREVIQGEVWVGLTLGVLGGYLAWRGMSSEVPAMTHKEFPVFFGGVVVFFAASVLGRSRLYAGAIVVVGLLLLVVQLWYNIQSPEDFYYLWKVWGTRPSQNKMFGLFRHYNPFAGYCALGGAVCAAMVFLSPRSVAGNVVWKGLLVGLSLLCIHGAFHSGSRMGAAVAVFSVMIAWFLGLATRLLIQEDGRFASTNRLLTVMGLGLLGVMLSVGGFMHAFGKASAQRGSSGDLLDDVMGGMRISSIGMGVSLWLKDPILGSGPRAYSYHAPRLRRPNSSYDHGNTGHPDAEMVHNDYIQTLAEYGIVGLGLVLIALGVCIYNIWRMAWLGRMYSRNWSVAPIAATAATAGIMLHSLGDFTMHNMSVFMQFSLVLGTAYGCTSWNQRGDSGERRASVYGLNRGVMSVVIGLLTGLYIWIGKPQILHARELLEYDREKWLGSREKWVECSREMSRKVPDPFLLEEFGHALLSSQENLSQENQRKHTEEAEGVYEQALALHPHRIEILVNLARVKLRLGKLHRAEQLIRSALYWSGERWRVYEVGAVAEQYLLLEGQALWRQRKPEAAMAYFEHALRYNEKGYWGRNDALEVNRKRSQTQILKNLTLLRQGRIEAKKIGFFGGMGLETKIDQ